jgi:CRP-like cAMP-binding protein
LASLPPQVGLQVASLCRIEHPPQGHVLTTVSEPASDVWFPHAGTVALITVDASGRAVQTGMVGREGCIGIHSLVGQRHFFSDAVVQIGGAMSVISAVHLKAEMQARPEVQAAVWGFLYGFAVGALQTIACNRLHSLHARCCRWLLTMRDKTASDDLPLTQESLAALLGGGRPRINFLLSELEKDGLLQRFRGRIRLLDRPGLMQHACDCYRLTSL